MKEGLVRLLDHLAWANQAVIGSLKSRRDIPQRAKAVLGHLLAAEQLWLCRIRNEPERALPVWADLTLADCQDQCSKNIAAYRLLLDSLDEERLRMNIAYVNSKGERFSSSVEDILIHACMHGSYHRGQIASLLRADGGDPVNTDYISYIRSVRGNTDRGK